MRLKWGSEEIDNFRMPTVERENWFTSLINRHFVWFVMAVMVGATAYFVIRIIQLYRIEIWLKNI